MPNTRKDTQNTHRSPRQPTTSAARKIEASGAGSSQRVERLLVLTEPPQLEVGEITDKGYVNQRIVREQRATHVRGYVRPIGSAIIGLALPFVPSLLCRLAPVLMAVSEDLGCGRPWPVVLQQSRG